MDGSTNENAFNTEKLEAEIQQLRKVVEAAPAFIWIHQHDGTVTYSNQRYLDYLGLTSEDLSRGAWREFIHPDERERVEMALLGASFQGREMEQECRIRNKTGGYRWFRVRSCPLRTAEGGNVQSACTAVDIDDRKRAEWQLRQRELLFGNVQDAVIAWDQNGRILQWNRAAEELYGWPAAETLGKSLQEILPAEPPLGSDQFRGVMESGGRCESELCRTTRTGAPMIVAARLALIESPAGTFILETDHDISRRVQAERAVRDREERLRLALDAGRLGTWEMNLATDKMIVSPRMEELMGLEPGQYQSCEDWKRCTHPEDRERVVDVFRSAIAGGTDFEIEHRFVWPDQSVHWVRSWGVIIRDATGSPQRATGVAAETTARKQAEEMSRQRNERVQVLSQCLAGFLTDHHVDEIVSDLFPRVAAMVGADAFFNYVTTPDEAESDLRSHIGIAAQAACEICDSCAGELCACIASDTRTTVIAEDIQHSNDSRFERIRYLGVQTCVCIPLLVGERLLGTLSFASRSKPRFAPDEIEFLEGVSGYTAIAMDRALNERAVREAQGSAEAAKHVAEAANRAKDDFIGALSHELRTPLTPILLTATSQECDEMLPSGIREQGCQIRRNVELESRLIEDLLDLTRVARGKFSLRPERIDIHELLGSSLEIVREDLLRKRLRLDVDFSSRLFIADADPARIQQVFLNLLKNAIKFTPDGGNIGMRTFNDDVPNTICIEVKDSGIGITPELLDKIFTPFEQGAATTTERFGGLGLGLAISKAIVDRHYGAISATSGGRDQGSTFHIRLPVTSATQVPQPPPPKVDVKPPIVPLRILLVEDHENTRNVLARLLARDGHHVEAVGSCDSAIKAIEKAEAGQAPRVQVLISDLGLPDCSGWNLIRQIKAHTPEIKAIALSGYGTEEDVRKSTEAGFNAHLTKPIGVGILREALAAQ